MGLKDIFRKVGEREIDLSIYGWSHMGNFSSGYPLDKRTKRGEYERHGYQNLEVRIENVAYNIDGMQIEGNRALYIRGNYADGREISPKVPDKVIGEAKRYRYMRKEKRKDFLLDVYRQVVDGAVGDYNTRFNEMVANIQILLNYFADKLRGLGLGTEADKLVGKIKEKFPVKEKKEYKGHSMLAF